MSVPIVQSSKREYAYTVQVEEVSTRVLRIEHLICVSVETGRVKDRERVRLLMEEGHPNIAFLAEICTRHHLTLPTMGGEFS